MSDVSHTPDGHSLEVATYQWNPGGARNDFPHMPEFRRGEPTRQEWEAFLKQLREVLQGYEQRIQDLENLVSQPTGSFRFLKLDEIRETVGEEVNGGN